MYESPELSIDFGEDSSTEARCGGEGFTGGKRKIEPVSGDLEDAKHCRYAGVAGEMPYCDERLTSISCKSSIPSDQCQDQFVSKVLFVPLDLQIFLLLLLVEQWHYTFRPSR